MGFEGCDVGGKGPGGVRRRGCGRGDRRRLLYPEGSVAGCKGGAEAGWELQGRRRQGEHPAVGCDAEEEEPVAGVVPLVEGMR